MVLLHEQEHAWIAHRNLALHLLNSLIYENIRDWSDKRVVRIHDLPAEAHCDRLALQRARRMFGVDAVEKELERMVRDADSSSGSSLVDYAESMMALDTGLPEPDLHRGVLALVAPYKAELLQTWQEEGPAFKSMCDPNDLEQLVGPMPKELWAGSEHRPRFGA